MIKISVAKEPEHVGKECRIYVEADSLHELNSTDARKLVDQYKHKVGASHMGLNKYMPLPNGLDKQELPFAGYWVLI